jgi:cephalosporin hydroxylase
MRRHNTTAVLLLMALALAGCSRLRRAPRSELVLRDEKVPAQLMQGVYGVTQGWRWTERAFSFTLGVPSTSHALYLELDLAVPEELMEDSRTVALLATANGVEVGRQVYSKPGRYRFTRYVPDAALRQRSVLAHFELDRSFRATGDRRDLGVIVLNVGLREYEQTAEYREKQNWAARQASLKAMKQVESLPAAKLVELRKSFFGLPGLAHIEFLGVPVDRNPLDLWIMQQVAFEVRPGFVIDTGTGEGGAALYWAHTLDGIGLPDAKVITIDSKNRVTAAARTGLWKRHIETMLGDPTAPAILARVEARVKNTATLAVLGAGEDVDGVLNALRVYAPLVSRGSYLVVENTAVDADPASPSRGMGPSEAVRRFLEEPQGKDFEVDSNRDLLVLTSSPGGWLRKK